MLAHDQGGSKSANRRQRIHLFCRPATAGLILGTWLFVAGGLHPPGTWAQPIPDRSPGPRLEVEPPADTTPREEAVKPPAWVLPESSGKNASLDQALEAARAGNAEACLAELGDFGSPEAKRLGFACMVALARRSQADALYYELSWNDAGRTAARLAAWRGIEDGDASLVRRSLQALTNRTPGENAALIWADWQEGKAVEAGGMASGTAAQFLQLAHGYQTGEPVEAGSLPPAWSRVVQQLQGRQRSGAREALLKAYDASLRGEWDRSLAEANQLLALYPNSEFRGQAYLLRSAGRLARGELQLARTDLNLAQNFLHAEMPVQLVLLQAFITLQEGDAESAENALDRLRESPLGREVEPMVLFHRARLARYRGQENAVVDAVLTLEEAYGDSPWYVRAYEDTDSERWGLPVLEMPIPPAASAEAAGPPREGPFGLLLWGDDILSRTAREVEPLVRERESRIAPREVAVVQARPLDASGAHVLAGGGSRDTRYLEGEWTRNDNTSLGFHLQGALTRAQEGSALPPSRRMNLGASVHQQRDYGRVQLEGRWDARTEGDDQVQARGATLALNFDSSDTRETSGVREAQVRGSFGKLSTPTAGWDYLRVETRGEGTHPALLGRLEGRWHADFGIHSHNGERNAPWLLDGGLFLPLGKAGRVGLDAAVAKTEFHMMPSARLQTELPGNFALWGRLESRMEYPDWHTGFIRDGDWNTPDFELAPVETPVHLSSGLSWRAMNLTLEASGTHFRSDNFRSWTGAEDGTWTETALDHVRGYELAFRGRRLGQEGSLLDLSVKHARVEQFGHRVPFQPTWTGRLEVGVPYKDWYYAGIVQGIAGRRNGEDVGYGNYLGLNLETTYHTPVGLAASLRLVNLTNSPVRRWPDKPIFSRGIYAGLGYRFGS